MLKGFKMNEMDNAIYEIPTIREIIIQSPKKICQFAKLLTCIEMCIEASVWSWILNNFFFLFAGLFFPSHLSFRCCNLKIRGFGLSVDMVGCCRLFFSSIYYCLPWFWEVLAKKKYIRICVQAYSKMTTKSSIHSCSLFVVPYAARTNWTFIKIYFR